MFSRVGAHERLLKFPYKSSPIPVTQILVSAHEHMLCLTLLGLYETKMIKINNIMITGRTESV